jgi:hypothetical protein
MSDEYDIWEHLNDTVASMCPQGNQFFKPAAIDGVANIIVDASKNMPVRVSIYTDRKLLIRNMCGVEGYDPMSYTDVKEAKDGKIVIIMTDSYGNALTEIADPGMLKLGIIPSEDPRDGGEYDRYTVTLTGD